ncbi:4Fe-4S binding protein [candidate division KSB1 bacterium]|nr:4Fe-4S binding protein [candidate division KSB1 bacterium]
MKRYLRFSFLLLIGLNFSHLTANLGAQDAIEWGALDEEAVVPLDESESTESRHSGGGFYYAIGAISAAVVAGLLLRYRRFRLARPLVLLAGLVVLGFINGGCPCMISSFQNFELWLLGESVQLHSLFWFLALIPATYLFGRVWCGWICHLGALQEFLYRGPLKAFRSDRSSKILRMLRWILFGLLVFQVAVTRSNIFMHYDPFKVAFNLFSVHTLGWWLLGLLLLTSLFIYRPFCRAACPVGLVLNWVSRIPGAFKLSINSQCSDCGVCSRVCPANAIDKEHRIDSGECILCGACLDRCKKDAIECQKNTR